VTVGPIDHVAVVVSSLEESLARYQELFGLQMRDDPIEPAGQAVRVAFVRTGDDDAAMIELIEPTDDESGVARFLASRGEGLHHVCLRTDDLPRDLAALAAHDVELIDREPRPGAHGDVAFVHPRSLNGVLWELLERTP
jgi:methylmalonyl-CoA/ethylmalonyl-CoA epimerase